MGYAEEQAKQMGTTVSEMKRKYSERRERVLAKKKDLRTGTSTRDDGQTSEAFTKPISEQVSKAPSKKSSSRSTSKPDSSTTPEPTHAKETTPTQNSTPSLPSSFSDRVKFGGGVSVDPTKVEKTIDVIKDSQGNVVGYYDKSRQETVGSSGEQTISEEELIKEQAYRTSRKRDEEIRVAKEKQRNASEVQAIEKKKGLERIQQIITKQKEILRTQTQREGATKLIPAIKQVGLGVATSVVGTVLFSTQLFSKPLATAKALGQGAISLGQKAITGQPLLSESVVQTIKQEPFFAAGFIAGEVLTAKGTEAFIKEAGAFAKKTYIRTGSEFVEPKKVFDPKVVSGESKFPTTRSTKDSIRQFEEADNIVQTSGSSKIKGGESGVGGWASQQGLQDPGIYVTPKGLGSPHFLGIEKEATKTAYTLNPFKTKLFNPIATVTEFQTKGVGYLPRRVVAKPGFKAVREFQEAQAGSGRAFITRRSEIGQGEILAGVNPEAQALKKTLSDPKELRGVDMFAKGTTELEAVIPSKQKFIYKPESFMGKIKGFDRYTTFEGELVAIRKAELVYDKPSVKTSFLDETRPLSSKQIQKESYSLSKLKSDVKYKNPYSELKTVSKGSYTSSTTSKTSSNGLSSSETRASSYAPSSTFKPYSSESTPKLSTTSYIPGSSSKPRPSKPYPSKPYPFKPHPSKPHPSKPHPSKPHPSKPIYTPNYGTSYSKIIPKEKKPILLKPKVKKKNKDKLFVQVRKKGKWETIAVAKGMTQAMRIGTSKVGTTASASMRVLTSQGSVAKLSKQFSSDFRISTKERGVLIERKERRIKSRGELQEITLKGIRSSKSKSQWRM